MPRREAAARLKERVRTGGRLLERRPQTWLDLQQLTQDYQLWSGENRDLLRSLFAGDGPGFEYSAFHGVAPSSDQSLAGRVAQLRHDIATKLARLEAITGRTAPRPLPDSRHAVDAATSPGTPARPAGVFLAHGGDTALGHTVMRFLEQLGLEIVPAGDDRDRVMELLEAPDAAPAGGYAIVLLTRGTQARVALELGYFLGALGRSSVTVLREDGADIPAGLSGVFYVPLDPGGVWKLLLARDLKRAAFPVDTTRILPLL